jgi:hypothetical protein
VWQHTPSTKGTVCSIQRRSAKHYGSVGDLPSALGYRAAQVGDLWLRIPSVTMEWFVGRDKSKRVAFVFSCETRLVSDA